MEKTYKHKKTGETATYKDGVFKQGRFTVEIGVEPSSEFWEEVVKKDYEVLQVISEWNGVLSVIGNFNGLGHGETIYSIKRLSDGQVFIIGDKLEDQSIESFLIDGNTIIVKKQIGWEWLKDVKKTKQLLFKTLDGVDVFKNQTYYGVYTKTFYLECVEQGIEYDLYEEDLPDETYITFSTKEKAEEWILMNKPVLSLNDLLSTWKGKGFYNITVKPPYFERLKTFVENKIKGDA